MHPITQGLAAHGTDFSCRLSQPSNTNAIANMRRAAFASRVRAAASRSSLATDQNAPLPPSLWPPFPWRPRITSFPTHIRVNGSAGRYQYLTVTLAEETFAVEIVKVREVIDYVHLTRVPRMPVFLRDVILDLRLILNMPSVEKTVDTCIIIAEVNMDGESLHLGMLADSVQEVIDIDGSQVDPPPKLMLDTAFIRGIGKRGEGFFIILNVDQVLSSEEIASIQAVRTSSVSRAAA